MRTDRKRLQDIARRALFARGLPPNLSSATLARTDCIKQVAEKSGDAVRDLRGLLWASINNDDSRDVDRLTVAEPMADGTVKTEALVRQA